MKTFNFKYIIVALSIFIAACKDDFLAEKRDLTGVNEEVFKDPLMATAYVDYIYGLFLPANDGKPLVNQQVGANGSYSRQYTQTTEELAGQSNWNATYSAIGINQVHAHEYFGQRMNSSINNNVWTRLRQINVFIDEIDKYSIAEVTRNQLKGQVYFWRAYQYFELLRLYGGVPLVLSAQNPIQPEGDQSNSTPRSSSSETLEQIVKDLDLAIGLLPPKWGDADWGRITAGAAAALKGRVLLTWASPLFNRTDDVTRWERAYKANQEAKTILEAAGFGLYKAGNLSNATAWENMFFIEKGNPEAVFVFGFNNISSDQVRKNNGTEQENRSKELLGSGGLSPTKQMLDAFPMRDGKMPGSSTYAYDLKKFYKNRDPRFYKTFVYNGALWPYSGNANFRQWTYSWFTTAAAATSNKPNRSTETLGANSSGIYLRKYTNPAASNSIGNFSLSGTDFMEIRFAEVILNLAEAAVGTNRLSEALDLMKSVRERAGVENLDGSFGFGDLVSRDQYFSAILNERKVEFAYEGKRFWDLRRWMLFNDDYGTVSRLGLTPLNGTRRTGLWIYVKNEDGTKYVGSSDPLIKPASGNASVIDRQPVTIPASFANYDEYLDHLYEKYFEVIEKDDLDPTNPSDWKFKWYNQYYFFGLHQNILTGSPYLEQTKDWPHLDGTMGTFDPLK